MARRIDLDFKEHLAQQTTTVAELLRFRLEDGRVFGVTGLDKDIFFDNMWWRRLSGLDSSNIATDSDLSVDNREVSLVLKAMEEDGLTFEEVTSGALDNGRYDFYLVNYQDTTQSLKLDAGDIGEVTVLGRDHVEIELLSFAVRLRTSPTGVDSVRCRAIFGTYPNTQKGCGVDASIMWRDGRVTGLGDELRRVFADSEIPLKEESFTYRLQFTSGKNASSRLYQLEAYSLISGTIVLMEATKYDIEIGDEFKIRPDCNKLTDDCKKYNNIINYKGEPYIPVADGLDNSIPNAQLPTGVTGGAEIEE